MYGFISVFRQARLLWPTVLALAAFVVLVSLGTWQWQRMAWKEGLLSKLQDAQNAAPSVLSSQILSFSDDDDVRFRRVRLKGTFLHDREIHTWMPDQTGSKWRIITPFKLDRPVENGSNGRVTHVLVIRGIVNEAHKLLTARPERSLQQQASVIGRLRFDSANWATPEPNYKQNKWYALHIAKMAAALKTSLPAADFAPFFVEAEAATAPPPVPQPNLQHLTLKNRHLEYALTWWGLALTLVGVYATFANNRLHQGRR